MVELNQLREYMRTQAREDRKRKVVQVQGDSVDDALRQASIELGIPVKRIDYEVLTRGSRGILGMSRTSWILIAYETERKDETGEDTAAGFFDEEGIHEVGENAERNGEVSVRFRPEGVYLKVSPPLGKGRKATERMAIEALAARNQPRYDASLVARVVKQAQGEYILVGDFDYQPVADPVLSLEITDGEMRAMLTATYPGPGGTDPTAEMIGTYLKQHGVVHGSKDDVLERFEDSPVYGQPVLVAEGTRSVNGADAKVMYHFDVDRSRITLKEKDGRVDFKELNLVQNVVEGQVLARKSDPEAGKNGRTVTGKSLPAKDGKDRELGVGKNVKLSKDGKTAISEINGQVLVINGKINVEPIHVVQGDVNLRSGNIFFLGTVIVKGSVEDGFSVKAAGNIEIMGSVGKCDLDAEGDIIVHQGITGRSAGTITCGHSLWAKYIENALVTAGEMVVVSDGIINSRVDANRGILCKGKRASIVGGHLRAAEFIGAKALGSVAGSETILEVGYDPKSKERITAIGKRKAELEKQLDEINLNLNTLANVKRVKKQLPEEKEQYLLELSAKRTEIVGELKKIVQESQEIQTYLDSLKTVGKVSASGKVFPGVKIFIKEAALEVRNEFKAVTFLQEGGIVKVTKYDEPEDAYSRRG